MKRKEKFAKLSQHETIPMLGLDFMFSIAIGRLILELFFKMKHRKKDEKN